MTYPQARERLFAHLRSLGWTVKPSLKIPQAVTPAGNVVYFKAQAVYLNQHSLWIDIREISPSQFVEVVVARESSRDPDRSRLSKASAYARQAAEYVQLGRDAEAEGMFVMASIWYAKAAARYAKSGGRNAARARLWARRAADVKGARAMGTTYRGEKKAWHRDPTRKTKARRLTASKRKSLRSSQFALPERRMLPLIDKAHVRNASARLEQMYRIHGTVDRSEYKEARVKIWAAEKRLKIGPYRAKKAQAKKAQAKKTKKRVRRPPRPPEYYVSARQMRSDGSSDDVRGYIDPRGNFIAGLRPHHRTWAEAIRAGGFR
jgi:hypothetical protein